MEEQKFDTVVIADQKLIKLNLAEVWKYRDLLVLFVKRNFISQYKQTILGPLWAIIKPFLTTVVVTIVFGNVAGLGPDGIPSLVFYFSGTVMWNYVSYCFSTTSTTFVSNSSVLGKVYFPRLVMPLSTVFSELITFFIQFAMLLCFLAYYVLTNQGVHPNIYILMTPLLLIQMILLSLGCGIIISALTTKYRDLAMAVAFLVEIWKYLSPVAYDMYSLAALDIGGKYHSLYMLNPFTPIVNCFRYAYLGIGHMEWNYYIIGWLITIGIFLIGVVMFNKVERTFADTV